MLETIWNENWAGVLSHIMCLGRIGLSMISIGLCIGILHRLLKENDGIKLIILGIFMFVTEYVMVSAVLFQMDSWGISTAVLLEAVINGIGYLCIFFYGRKRWKQENRIRFAIRPYWPMLCICLLALLMANGGNGYYGMQQDQGVYQTSALAMIYGDGKNVKELSVYEKLSDEDQERFMHVVPTGISGFYFYEDKLEGLYSIEFETDTTGYFHGIPTYPALLALWGGMFGFRYMGGIQRALYLLLIGLAYLLLDRLGCKKWLAGLGCVVVAVSPIILWTVRSALTEVYLACALLVFLYFLIREEKVSIWLSAMAMIGFGCVHFSIYTIMPIVILIYAGLYMRYRERAYIGAGILVTACFWFTVNLTRMISTGYFYGNMEPLMGIIPWLNRGNTMGFVTAVCVAVITAGAVILLCSFWHKTKGEKAVFPQEGTESAGTASQQEEPSVGMTTRQERVDVVGTASQRKRIEGASIASRQGETDGTGTASRRGEIGAEKKRKLRLISWGIRILVAAWCVLAVATSIGRENDGSSSVLGLCVLGGVVMLPAGLAGILAKPQLLWKDRAGALTGALFAYCVMFYSLGLRRDISYYYYYGRYLVPFIPFVVLQGVQALLLLKGRIRIAAGVVVATAQLLLLPYDLVLTLQKDDTRMDWEALEDVCAHIGPNDVLIIEDDMLNVCYLPLTYMLQADVLPQLQHSPREAMQLYASQRGITYYLSAGTAKIEDSYTVLRRDYMVSEDSQTGDRGILGLPISMDSGRRYLQLDRLVPAKTVYTAEDDCWINMFMDEEGVRWGSGSEYGLSFYLDNSIGYRAHIYQGAEVPLEIYGVEFYPVQVYVNGQYLQEMRVYRENGTGEIAFDIPASYLQTGENILLFRGEPWKPIDFGEADFREMGINISSIWFEGL